MCAVFIGGDGVDLLQSNWISLSVRASRFLINVLINCARERGDASIICLSLKCAAAECVFLSISLNERSPSVHLFVKFYQFDPFLLFS